MRTAMGLLTAMLALSGVGCAAIVTGTRQTVKVNSTPPGAGVTLDEVAVGETPVEITVKRGGTRIVRVTKEGYEPAVIPLNPKFNGWFLGNALLGGIVGLAIDMGTGAWMWVDPEAIDVELKPKSMP